MNIYAGNLVHLSLLVLLALIVWLFLQKLPKASMVIAAVGCLISVYAILSYTVLGRTRSETHSLTFAASYTNEFFREMFMNALLYVPLGMCLSIFLGPWMILVAFIMSTGVETWQYLAGTGLAQGTDVIMNTLGAVLGSIPYLIMKWIKRNNETFKADT